jgi:hypothetical protein
MFAKLLPDDFYGKKWTNARAWADENGGDGGETICTHTMLLTEFYRIYANKQNVKYTWFIVFN